MVTRSDINYEQHKADIYKVITENKNEKTAKRFMDFYSSRYDKHGRSFIDWKLAYSLMFQVKYLRNDGTNISAIVGDGGTGKTTLGMNKSYYIDNTFDYKRISWDTLDFMSNVKNIGRLQSIMSDEPDDTFPSISKEGKIIRSVLGKIRQMNIDMTICATDMTDIPQYMWKKVRVVYFTPFKGATMMFVNKPKKAEYPIQEIRKYYTEIGYKIFFQLKNSAGCLNCKTINGTTINKQEMEAYLAAKRGDFDKTLDSFIKSAGEKSSKYELFRQKVVNNLLVKGYTQEQIGEIIETSQSNVNYIRKKAINNQ
jgi:hypothetical protein